MENAVVFAYDVYACFAVTHLNNNIYIYYNFFSLFRSLSPDLCI